MKQMAKMACQLRDEGGNAYLVSCGDVIDLDEKDDRFVPIDNPEHDFLADNFDQLMTKDYPVSELRRFLENTYKENGLKNKGKDFLIKLLLKKRDE